MRCGRTRRPAKPLRRRGSTRFSSARPQRTPPPIVAGRRIKLKFAHQGGRFPPIVVIHGGRAERMPQQYRRYLTNAFRDALGLVGTPLKLEFRSGENPFEGRRNALTRRQHKRRQRVIRHRR